VRGEIRRMSSDYGKLLLLRDLVLLLFLIVVWLRPTIASRWISPIEKWGSRLALRKSAAILITAALVLVLRIGSLPMVKVPIPSVADEFAYLLAGDTFVHGRLANPAHPMWVFFETFNVNQLPTYASMYPPAQGAALAIGELLGHPWIGVLLSVACLCAAITWALQGWVAPRWAFLGGVLAATQFGAVNYWMESYWGGAMAAIGGALVAGAFPRILRHQRPRHAVLFGLGMGIMANSRPFEGAVLGLVFAIALGWALFRNRNLQWRTVLARVVIPAAVVVLVLAGGFTGYYNWRVTGNPLLLPHVANTQVYWTVPPFRWQSEGAPHEYFNPQFKDYYDSYRKVWESTRFVWAWAWFKTQWLDMFSALRAFYAPPELGIPILFALLLLPRNKKVFFCFIACAAIIGGILCLWWCLPHYFAPATACVYILIILGFRTLRQWTIKGRPTGLGMARALVAFHVAFLGAQILAAGVLFHGVPHRNTAWAVARARMEEKIESMPGRHLVLVRYPSKHIIDQEWVYNLADLDHSKVVWAREIPGRDTKPLLDYFHDRELWLLEPDAPSGPAIRSISSSDYLNASAERMKSAISRTAAVEP
jgi:hypothetical protein